MAKITFITSDNEEIVAEATSGTVMELAKENNVNGIDGDCGGVCSCATCHVHVAEEDFEKVGAPGEIEADMLELEDNYNERSRLCCQIDMSDAIDGVTLYVAN
ncbi:2Fe-2S iron-sulfur cluster-binding protein [Reichenbachiella carrageenanivorans]|uniref:2Fe-2S iron-sulfur cluster-binding protein n=1 Tax=Reichenbachiella carrageenanivorans TaxID=2979869 RepID=A0ABY6CVE2_9BACT|nr:2Fe-2S iron-sulfur cluster-binding protein [Reichenbachiella carrageenanivorans]UXX77875.1 2Fe-2S iron-sulfur cluster-binding protein [Reichenbachiella carrageenanivorans]